MRKMQVVMARLSSRGRPEGTATSASLVTFRPRSSGAASPSSGEGGRASSSCHMFDMIIQYSDGERTEEGFRQCGPRGNSCEGALIWASSSCSIPHVDSILGWDSTRARCAGLVQFTNTGSIKQYTSQKIVLPRATNLNSGPIEMDPTRPRTAASTRTGSTRRQVRTMRSRSGSAKPRAELRRRFLFTEKCALTKLKLMRKTVLQFGRGGRIRSS